MLGKREYGDYQTPPEFARRVCLYLKEVRKLTPSAVVEPTCGEGHFLQSSLMFDAEEYYGIEINPEYCNICKKTIPDARVTVLNADFFSCPSNTLIKNTSQVLIIGNPPWVTNSSMSNLDAQNLPQKTNFKGLRGIDAVTGASNFDICEYMILKLIKEYKGSNATIAMLCKTSVARKVFQEMKRNKTPFKCCDILEFNATQVFHINASACLLFIQLSSDKESPSFCSMYDFDNPEKPKKRMGFIYGRFYSNLDITVDDFEGQCCFEWRQGVKHDCSRIMELTREDTFLFNGNHEKVEIENDIVFPLVKSSMFKKPVIHDFSKFVIVTQRTPREETRYLETTLKKTWNYLNKNKELFDSRKSSIYRGAPSFSMFGVGEYSYSRYKVGVSGLYKQPLFSVLYSNDEKPVMTDDTSYFICFNDYDRAYTAMLLLNSERVQNFIKSIVFPDAKRPYTKKILDRIDFSKIIRRLSINDLKKTEFNLGLTPYITDYLYDSFQDSLRAEQLCLGF